MMTTLDLAALGTFILDRFALVADPAGVKYATAIGPNGFKQFPLGSIALRDTIRRQLEDRGEPFDETAFDTLIARWLDMDFATLSTKPQSRACAAPSMR